MLSRTTTKLTKAHQDENSEGSACTQSNKKRVVRRGGSRVSRNLCIVETLSGVAVERDGLVSKHVVDELVHGRLLERATLARDTVEAPWTFDFLCQKVVDIDRTIFPTQEASRNTGALDLLTPVIGLIRIVRVFPLPRALSKVAVKRLNAIDPKLELAGAHGSIADIVATLQGLEEGMSPLGRAMSRSSEVGGWFIGRTGKGHLRRFVVRDGVDDFAVGDVAHLEVLFHRETTLVAGHVVLGL